MAICSRPWGGRTTASPPIAARSTPIRGSAKSGGGLANLKTIRFGAEDRAAMESALVAAEPDANARADDRLHLHFALGKAYDDAAEHERPSAIMARATRSAQSQLGYRAPKPALRSDAIIATCTAEFFASRAESGDPAPDPIFILGMPRAGSTLIEQISRAIGDRGHDGTARHPRARARPRPRDI